MQELGGQRGEGAYFQENTVCILGHTILTSKDSFDGFVWSDNNESTWLNLAVYITALALLFLQLLIATATDV